MSQGTTLIYGKHAVSEALTNTPQAVTKVYINKHTQDEDILARAHLAEVNVKFFTSDAELTFADKNANHQGYIAEISLDKLMLPYRDFIQNLSVTPETALVLLGEIQDPQNVGAIIRSAAAFGVAGILFPEHNQAHVSGVVVKVSAGMTFRVPLVAIGNVNTTIRDLKEKGFWIYGMDETATHPLHKETFDAPAVFVLGNEGAGIREKTRELCDILISIPMNPRCESLNVASSGTVMLYEWSSQHPQSLK